MHRISNEINQIRNTNREIRFMFSRAVESLKLSDLFDNDRTCQETLLRRRYPDDHGVQALETFATVGTLNHPSQAQHSRPRQDEGVEESVT